jgi:hypothetical protein
MQAGKTIRRLVRGPRLEPSIAVLCALIAGCDPQATDAYDGESLLTVRGRVELTLQRDDEAQLKPALAFQTESDAKFRLIDVSTRGAFPAELTMDVLEPPPEDAIFEMEYLTEQPRVAVGYIAAVTPDLPREFAYDMPPSFVTQTMFDDEGMRWDCDAENGFCYFDEEHEEDGVVRVRRTTCPSLDTPREMCSESYPFEPVDMYRHFAGLSVSARPRTATTSSCAPTARGMRATSS